MKWTDELLMAEQMRLEQAAFDGGVERYKKSQRHIKNALELQMR